KILEQVALDQLHEGRGITVDVMRAGVVERGVARRGDVDHGRHLELAELLVERVPPLVGERRIGPVAASRIRVQVYANKSQAGEALELGDAVLRRDARVLR